MNQLTVLPTANPTWGFYGSTEGSEADKDRAWAAASRYYQVKYNLTPEQATVLLDARFGRHLADALEDTTQSFESIDARWPNWVSETLKQLKKEGAL